MCVTVILSSNTSFAQCATINHTSFESNLGFWIDGGYNAYRTNYISRTGDMSMRLRSNSGLASSIYSKRIDLTSAILPELNFFYYPESMEDGEKLMVDISYDDGISYTNLSTLVAGIDFSNYNWYNTQIDLSLIKESPVRFMIRTHASSISDKIYIDDLTIQDCGRDIILNEENKDEDCNPGSACDDLDPCTADDVFDIYCNCVGKVMDEDNDGICDIFDICANGDDSIDLNEDGTPDACEIIDQSCFNIDKDGFEKASNYWVDGGINASRNSDISYEGDYSYRLRGNSGTASSIYTIPIDLTNLINPQLHFQYFPQSMENGEKLQVEISLDLGDSYLTIQTFAAGTDFSNYSWHSTSIGLKAYGTSTQTLIRIRCEASSNMDRVYIDNIVINDCEDVIAGAECSVNTPCDDKDECTINDTLNSDCDCIGIFLDSDNDGVCDSNDICQPGDDNVDSNHNGIPDSCEILEDCLLIDDTDFENGFGNWIDGGASAMLSTRFSFDGIYSVRLSRNNGQASSITSPIYNLSSNINPVLSAQIYSKSLSETDQLKILVSVDNRETFFELASFGMNNKLKNYYWVQVSVPLHTFGLEPAMSFRIVSASEDNYSSIYVDQIKIEDCEEGLVDVLESNCQIGNTCNDGDDCTTNDMFDSNCDCVGTPIESDCTTGNINPTADQTVSRELVQKDFSSVTLDIKVYPNPASDFLSISGLQSLDTTQSLQIRIVNLIGQEMKSSTVDKFQNEIVLDLYDLTSGQLYFIQILSDKRLVDTHKILKV